MTGPERFPPLAHPNPHELARGNTLVDASMAAMGPDHYEADPAALLADVTAAGLPMVGKVFTPWERRPPRVAEELARVINDPGDQLFTFPSPQEMADGLDIDYIHSDFPDRRVLPAKPNGRIYTPEDLREELIHRGGDRPVARREALAKREQQYIDEELTAACTGPIVKQVILHSKSPVGVWSSTRWELADRYGGPAEDRRRELVRFAVPVPAGYTAFRIARKLAEDFGDGGCWWCPRSTMRTPLPVLLASTGGALRGFSTCRACRESFGPGPDYYTPDGFDARHGHPAERHR